MNISYFNYHYNIRGSARGAAHQVETIAEQLRKRGHTVNVHYRAARNYDKESPGKAESSKSPLGWLKKFGWARRYLNVPKMYLRNFKFISQEKKLIEKDKADVVLAVNSYMNFSARKAARKAGVPFVLFCDAPMHYEYTLFWSQSKTYSWLGRKIERENLQKAAAVTCVSEIFKGYLVNYGVPAEKITVVPNGADAEVVNPETKDVALLDSLGLQGKTVAGFVGSFNFFDDVLIMASIINRLLADHPELNFLFVGKGTAGDQLAEALGSHVKDRRVIFTGALPHAEAMRHLSVMDIVFTPYLGNYLFYGSSMKLLEYMAAGKAVICTALGQNKELISNGFNGMLFKWRDYETLEKQFDELVRDKDLRATLGNNARKTILDGWTWEHQAEKLEQVLLRAQAE